MINLSDYRLTYYEKETGRIVRARRVCTGEYIVLDPITGLKERVTRYSFSKKFKSHEINRKIRSENFRQCKEVYSFQD